MCQGGWVVPFAAAVGMACYLNSAACSFVFDDQFAIVTNKDVLEPPPSPLALWTHDFWGKPLYQEDSHKSYRPLTVLTFRLQAWLDGAPRAPAFHLVNAALHAAVCAAAAETSARAWRGLASGGRRLGLLVSLLFAAHPVHVEAVTGTVGRAEMLCALFCFGGVAAHARAAGALDGDGWRRGASVGRLAAVLAMIACIAAAVLSKETGVALLGILGAQEVLIILPTRGRHGVRGTLARLSLLVGCGLAYALMRVLLMSTPGEPLSLAAASLRTSALIRRAENPLLFLDGRATWMLSVAWVQARLAETCTVDHSAGARDLRTCSGPPSLHGRWSTRG